MYMAASEMEIDNNQQFQVHCMFQFNFYLTEMTTYYTYLTQSLDRKECVCSEVLVMPIDI